MPNLTNDIETFEAYCRTGRVPDLKSPGELRKLGKCEMQAIISIVRNAISDGLGVPLGAEVEVTEEYLRNLPWLARTRAEHLGLHRPGEHARAAKVFCETLLMARGADKRRPVGSPALVPVDPDDVPAGFRSMYDPLEKLVQREPQWRSMRGAFRDCALLFAGNGVLVPEGVRDREQFDMFADAAGLDIGRRNHLLSGWRKAREQACRTDLSDLKQTIRSGAAGLSGCELVPASMRMLPFAEQVAKIARDLSVMRADYLARKDIAPDTRDALDGALSWLLAENLRVAAEEADGDEVSLEFLQTFDPMNAFLTPHGVAPTLSPAEQLRASKTKSSTAPVPVSLMRHLVDRAAVRSSASSDLLVKREGKTVEGAIWYTQALFHDLSRIRLFVYEFIGRTLEASDAEEDRVKWQRVQTEYDSIVAAMNERNKLVGDLANHRDKARLHVTWPQLVFYGLPALRARVVSARQAWADCGRKTGKLDSRYRRRLWFEYENRMIEFIVFAVFLADAMRIANYAGALTGGNERVHHFQLKLVRDGDGRACGIDSVKVVYRRNDTPMVRLKKRDGKDVRDRERAKELEPGLVDCDLLWQYVTEVRPARLRRRNINGADEYSIENDGYAFFVASRNGPNKKNPSGGFTTDALGSIFGRTLHYVCVEVLRLNEREGLLADELIPTWRELRNVKQWKHTDLEKYERLSRWKALFAPHIVRNLYNVYFYGIRGNLARAMRTTDDTLKVIVENYNVYAEDLERRLHEQGPTNPKWFDAAVDEIMRPRRKGDDWKAFWRAFDPRNPGAAVAALRAA